jgi:hypothetical protein
MQGSHKTEELNGRSNADASTVFSLAFRSCNDPKRNRLKQKKWSNSSQHLLCTDTDRITPPKTRSCEEQRNVPTTQPFPRPSKPRCWLRPLSNRSSFDPAGQHQRYRQTSQRSSSKAVTVRHACDERAPAEKLNEETSALHEGNEN